MVDAENDWRAPFIAENDWRAPFIAFLADQMEPEDKAEHEKVARRSTSYVVIRKELYRKAASTGVLMRCILRSEEHGLLVEVLGGECSNHAASANLVGKAFRSDFY